MKWILLAVLLAAPVSENDVIARIEASGRCVSVAETPDSRVGPGMRIAPGPPPLVSFRYYQGKLHQRFGNSELMLDDAGH
jgi:hypothetical protein